MNELFADQALIEAIQTLGKKMKSPADLAMLNSELVRITVEAALNGEMEVHLGYSKHAPAGYNTGNSRNGYNRKTLKGQHGEIEIARPRELGYNFVLTPVLINIFVMLIYGNNHQSCVFKTRLSTIF